MMEIIDDDDDDNYHGKFAVAAYGSFIEERI